VLEHVRQRRHETNKVLDWELGHIQNGEEVERPRFQFHRLNNFHLAGQRAQNIVEPMCRSRNYPDHSDNKLTQQVKMYGSDSSVLQIERV
jgi:hypothetical protein